MGEPLSTERPAVDVRVIGDETVKKEAAPYGAWRSYKLLGTEAPQQILPQSERRSRAVIYVLPGYVNNNTVGAVFVGSRAQCMNPNPSDVAGILVSGTSVVVESQQELWLVPNGVNSLTVTVLDERYA